MLDVVSNHVVYERFSRGRTRFSGFSKHACTRRLGTPTTMVVCLLVVFINVIYIMNHGSDHLFLVELIEVGEQQKCKCKLGTQDETGMDCFVMETTA